MTYIQLRFHIQILLNLTVSLLRIMSSTKSKILKPKIETSIRKHKKSIHTIEKKEHDTQLNSKTISKQIIPNSSYIISCKSCFWNVPFHNYNNKNETIYVFKICPACYSHDLEYVSIPYTKLLKYIRINLN
jgi:hypothetical protein